MKAYLIRRILNNLQDVRVKKFDFTETSFTVKFDDMYIYAPTYEALTDKIELYGSEEYATFESLIGLSNRLNEKLPKYENNFVKKIMEFFTAFDTDAEAVFFSVNYTTGEEVVEGVVEIENGSYCRFRITEDEIEGSFFDEYKQYICTAHNADEVCEIADELTYPSL